jgi:transposase
MEVLWLISCGESYSSAARLADASAATVDHYVALDQERGLDGLKQFDWQGPTRELITHQISLEKEFRARPPHTISEACRRIEETTRIKRGRTPVRHFLKKSRIEVVLHGGDPAAAQENRGGARGHSGDISRRKAGTTARIEPAPAVEQFESSDHVFLVVAAHFVQGAFLCCLWCACRLLIRSASGRQRYSVLGAWNAVTNELARITTAGTVSSETMCDLLRQIVARGLTAPPSRMILDNARYQRRALVTNLAKTLQIELEFLPPYSPKLNLIEGLWKFVKRDILYGRYYDNFTEYCRAIDGGLNNIPTKHRPQLAALMTHNFQQFNPASLLAA